MAKELTALRLDAELLEAMRRVRAQEGIPITTQIEFALHKWLTAKGALKARTATKARKRASHG
jgi:hypothetical protein